MDNPTDKLAAAIAANESCLGECIDRASAISQRVPGWSAGTHYLFFRSLFDAFPEIKTVLILGVYLGRDISFMLDCAKGRELQVVGVDKFNAEPCDDWPEEKRGLTWEQAFGCSPPDAKQALANINAQPPHQVRLIEADDAVWLPSIKGTFDFIYIDTSHDYLTVSRQIKQVRPLCAPHTIIAGDDYNDIEKTWGVRQAVTDGFTAHQVVGGIIWFAGAEDFK